MLSDSVNLELRKHLFNPLSLGPLALQHRIVMAPLTRMRASRPGNEPNSLNALYYTQRASEGGLMIAEASQVVPEGQGMPATPGIHTDAQVAGWRLVTDGVHAARWAHLLATLARRPYLPLFTPTGRSSACRAIGHRSARQCVRR